jgi:N-methylhydantoinase A
MRRPVASKREARVGVDIGGTFTDIVVWLSDGALHISKVSSTPLDPGVAVIEGLAALLRELSIPPETVKEIVHGTRDFAMYWRSAAFARRR